MRIDPKNYRPFPPEQPASEVAPLTVMDLIYGRSRPDSVIALGSRRQTRTGDPAPHYLAPVLVKDRNEMLPAVFEYCLTNTQYLMPNTLSQSALHDYNRENIQVAVGHYYKDFQEQKIRYFHAANEHVRELTSLFVDLDVGRNENDISAPMAIGIIADMAMREEIPMPSLAAFSGRGAYCIWLLTDDAAWQAPLNSDDNRARWKLCTAELVKRTRDLKSDKNATRLANWYKRPGTIDTSTGRQVVYTLFGVNDIRNVPFYSLSSMVKTLSLCHTDLDRVAPITQTSGEAEPITPSGDVPEVDPPRSYTESTERATPVADLGKRQRKVSITKGSEPAKLRAYEIELVAQARKGVPEGVRHMFLLHYFWSLLRYYKITRRNEPDGKRQAWIQAREATWQLNKTFKPPLNANEFKTAIQKPTTEKLARASYLAELLHVTEAEAVELNLRHILPENLRKEREAFLSHHKQGRRSEKEKRTAMVDSLLVQLRDGQITLNFSDIAKEAGTNKMEVSRRANLLGIVAKKWARRGV